MNTNSNIYTIIYTTVVCVLVAAILAVASQALKPKQQANQKAETISQILQAAKFDLNSTSNTAIINFYKDNISKAVLLDAEGKQVGELDTKTAEVYSTSDLKVQNYNIKGGSAYAIPAYIFRNGTTVLALYGAGLWGPVWGYLAVDQSGTGIVGAYFDHSSETPGLGGKIKDDPSFRGQFSGKKLDFSDEEPFHIVKGGAPEGADNAIDAITGATMTSKGVNAAINVWMEAYRNYLLNNKEE